MSGTRRKPGLLGPYVEGYRGRLLAAGYSPAGVVAGLGRLGQLGRWMQSEGIAPDQLGVVQIEAFLVTRREGGFRQVPSMRAFRALLEYLTDEHVIATQDALEPTALEGLVGEYRDWLVHDRGLAAVTVLAHVSLTRRFLARTGSSAVDLRRLTGADVAGFLLEDCSGVGRAVAGGRASVLRSLLRFLFLRALTPLTLAEAVPPVAGWRDSGLVVSMSGADVQALLDGFDRSRPAGIRDFAILMLLARLGLRSVEVARLELDDVDWRAGELTVRGKGYHRDLLPLSAEVGQSLADYLTDARPRSEQRGVFLTVRAPYQRIRRGSVGDIVRRACQRSGLQPVGAHRLRHAVATELLAKGSSLADIAEVLRHRDVATTAIYAKVDIDALRPLARPWPGAIR